MIYQVQFASLLLLFSDTHLLRDHVENKETATLKNNKNPKRGLPPAIVNAALDHALHIYRSAEIKLYEQTNVTCRYYQIVKVIDQGCCQTSHLER